MPFLSCFVTTVILSWTLSSNWFVVNETSLLVPSNGVISALLPLYEIFENWYLVRFVTNVLPVASLILNVYLYSESCFSIFTSFSNKLAYVEICSLSFWYFNSPFTVVGKVAGTLSAVTAWSGTVGAAGLGSSFGFTGAGAGVTGFGLAGATTSSNFTGLSLYSLAVS